MIRPLPNESPGYTKLRAELLEAEIELKEARERVAALRRELPADTPCEDHVFSEIPVGLGEPDAAPVNVKLSQLFDDPSKPLVLVHFMFGKAQEKPCPMCTMWADGYDAVMPHLLQRVSFAMLVAGDPAAIRRHARERGWRNVRIVSAAGSTLKAELGLETEDGAQLPGVSVFTLAEDGSPRHFYSSCAIQGNGHFRGMDLLTPAWSFFDLTPDGRGEFMPSLSYS